MSKRQNQSAPMPTVNTVEDELRGYADAAEKNPATSYEQLDERAALIEAMKNDPLQERVTRSIGIFSGNVTDKATEAYTKIKTDLTEGAGSFVRMATKGTPFAKLGEKAGNAIDKKLGITDKAVADKNKDLVKKVDEKGSAGNTKSGESKAVEKNTNHMVSLTDTSVGAIADQKTVLFEVMPEVTEQRQVQYEAVAPPQFIGAFQKFKGTDSVQWIIQGQFVARNSFEASKNLAYLRLLRSWTLPFFGQKILTVDRFAPMLGAPPPVLMFTAYSKNLIGPVPTVITGLNWSWPKDVDYIQALDDGFSLTGTTVETFNAVLSAKGDSGNLIPFPAVINITVNLVESFSIGQFNAFDLEAYRRGNMIGAYVGAPSKQPVGNTNQPAQTIQGGVQKNSEARLAQLAKDERLPENQSELLVWIKGKTGVTPGRPGGGT